MTTAANRRQYPGTSDIMLVRARDDTLARQGTATDRALADYDAKNLEQANTIRAL